MNTIGDRLKDERIRIGLSQSAFAEVGGVKRLAQGNYENGDRYPDALYLFNVSKIGVDIFFVITGQRNYEPVIPPTAEEQVLLDGFKLMDSDTKKRILAFVLMGEMPNVSQKDRQNSLVMGNNVKVGSNNTGMVSGENLGIGK